MQIAQVSERGQITIPAEVRRRLGLRPGAKLEIEVRDDAIILRPIPSISALAGIFRRYAREKPADWKTVRTETERAVAKEVAQE